MARSAVTSERLSLARLTTHADNVRQASRRSARARRAVLAIELEVLWNDLGRDLPFSLFCAYPRSTVAGGDDLEALEEVCRLHSAVVGGGAPLPSKDNPPGRVAERSFAASTSAPGEARRFVTTTLRKWGDERAIEDAALIVTELATNAVLHAHSGFSVTPSHPGETVRISVHDESSVPAVLGEPELASCAGRGLGLVAALATAWGTGRVAGGKKVWADLGA